MLTINRKFIDRQRRDGISIIEVLTSMAVATIGVFGIMVMIPFAVKQSQTGLDNDAANAVGRNVVEELQVLGFMRVLNNGNFARLRVKARADGATTGARTIRPMNNTDFDNDRAPGLFHFDPIGFAAPDPDGDTLPLKGLKNFTIPDAAAAGAINPPVAYIVPDDPNGNIEIFSATATRGVDINTTLLSSDPLTSPEASLLCRSDDDVVYAEEVEGLELAPPQPIFDIDPNGNLIKQQSIGRISWSAFMVPELSPSMTSAPANRFKSHVLVYRDRFVNPANPMRSSYEFYRTTMAGSGHISAVSQITIDTVKPIIEGDISRGDWVMLVNRIPEAEPGVPVRTLPAGVEVRVAEQGYRTQVMFAKVTRVTPGSGGFGGSVAVDGGPFDFVSAGVAGPTGSMNPASSLTYMVHLKDVVNVYERSVSVEK
ncbi:type IV pilus modification PilV family protein [Mariniblastus fucicola]|uniref:Uncharacterized protein n=1 Tax=Mariniblastus fucicola TaxID=980251 RepID=A0A5B9PBS2_9BACT|nr:hypothetical protein [Mariniblastus fucicola]QEG20613.1 hypothetical protein MFFC18_04630 [Mariniblastus fucicola]